jgi:hypothetical protein
MTSLYFDGQKNWKIVVNQHVIDASFFKPLGVRYEFEPGHGIQISDRRLPLSIFLISNALVYLNTRIQYYSNVWTPRQGTSIFLNNESSEGAGYY